MCWSEEFEVSFFSCTTSHFGLWSLLEAIEHCHLLLVLFGICSIPVINELHLVSSGSKSYLISGGDSSCSWVVPSCTGSMEKKEPLTVLLGGELVTRSSTFREEYKHSAWIQSLLITPKTG